MSWPSAPDNFTTNWSTADPDRHVGPDVDAHADALNRIELELGINPSGTDTDVATRLDAIATALVAEASARTAADATKLPLTGGTLTGALTLSADPTSALQAATRQWVLAQITALINGAPGTLDTLKEIADQLGADESAVAALTTSVAGKLASSANLSDLGSITTARTNLGLGTAALKDAPATGDASATQTVLGNDSHLPTSGQKNALAGAHGTPGTGTEYLTKASIGAAGVAGKALAADDPTVGVGGLVTPNAQTTDYTAVLGDAGKLVLLTAATTKTVTIPPNSSVAYPTGSVIRVQRGGTGQVNVAAGAGVTINAPAGFLSLLEQYSQLTLTKTATDTWQLTGGAPHKGEVDAALAALTPFNTTGLTAGDYVKYDGTQLIRSAPATVLDDIRPAYGGGNFHPYNAWASGEKTAVTNRLYVATIRVPWKTTISGIRWVNGNGTATGARIGLWSPDGATRLAVRATDFTPAGAYGINQCPFDAAYAATPGLYHIGLVIAGGVFVGAPLLSNVSVISNGSLAIPTSVTPPSSHSGSTDCPNMVTY